MTDEPLKYSCLYNALTSYTQETKAIQHGPHGHRVS